MKGRRCDTSRPGDGDSGATRVRYEPGNLGDLIKHLWLIEIVSFLKQERGRGLFRLADTFCGFNDYEIRDFFAQRIRKCLSASPLYRPQKASLNRGRYLGSVHLALEILGPSARIDIFDTNPLAVKSFNRRETRQLKLKSGYDVLEREKHYDLIFMDPYDDVRSCHGDIVRKIVHKTGRSSILLFFPYSRASDLKGVLKSIGQSGARCVSGFVGRGDRKHDGPYSFALFFFPSVRIGDKEMQRLSERLRRLTAWIQRLSRRPGIESPVCTSLAGKSQKGHP